MPKFKIDSLGLLRGYGLFVKKWWGWDRYDDFCFKTYRECFDHARTQIALYYGDS